jgi:hypothetical protein
MGFVLILTPVVVGGWPVVAAAVAGAASALGLAANEVVKQQIQQQQKAGESEQNIEVELAESKILLKDLATDKEIVLTKGNIELRISRDARGRCSVCAKGKARSKAELKQIAEQFAQKMTQCFVYNRVLSEMKNKGFAVVNEEVTDDEAIRIHVRRWVD